MEKKNFCKNEDAGGYCPQSPVSMSLGVNECCYNAISSLM